MECLKQVNPRQYRAQVLFVLTISTIVGLTVLLIYTAPHSNRPSYARLTSFPCTTIQERQLSSAFGSDGDDGDGSLDRLEQSSPIVIALLLCCLSVVCVVCLVYAVVIPLTFRHYHSLHYRLVFSHHIHANIDEFRHSHPPNLRPLCLVHPESVQHPEDSGIQIKAWHVYPVDCQPAGREDIPGVLGGCSHPVVMYVHGKHGTRGCPERSELYTRLAGEGLNAHVISFDYRCFDQSTSNGHNNRPTMGGVVRDAHLVYEWCLGQGATPGRIVLWGHSLGTGITIRMLSQLAPPTTSPLAAVLEAPFTCLSDTIAADQSASWFRPLPWFECCILDPITKNPNLNLSSVDLLHSVHCPLLILHAQDDDRIPCQLGRELYERARKHQPAQCRDKTRSVFYPAKFGYSHSYLVKAPDLVKVVHQFLEDIAPKTDTVTDSTLITSIRSSKTNNNSTIASDNESCSSKIETVKSTNKSISQEMC